MGFVVDTVAPSTRPNCVAPTMAGMFTVISTALVSGNCANSNEPPLIVGIMTSGVTASGRLLRASRVDPSPRQGYKPGWSKYESPNRKSLIGNIKLGN